MSASSSTRSAAAAAPRLMDELSRYGRAQRSLELAGVSLFVLLAYFNFLEMRLDAWSFPLLLLAWISADLLSGVAHWAFDRFGSVRTPLVGPAFIRPFREHHVDPAAMTQHDFVETNGSSALACVPLLGLALYAGLAWQAFLVFLCLGILVTNQCHKWAHAEHPPRLAVALQRVQIILNAKMHARHHMPPYRSHYCTASGWLNPLLNALLK
jgi:plasmanylethanolamine desaturase